MSKLVRLSLDKTKGIVEDNNAFSVLNFDSESIELTSETFPEGEWSEPTTEERIAVLPLVAALSNKKRRSVEAQPRDNVGRWVAAGANVKWRSANQDWAGTVLAIKDGKAIVQVRHDDGSTSKTTLEPNTLRVLASKARLGTKKKFQDNENNAEKFIGNNKKEIEEAAGQGGATINRKDGYSIDVAKIPGDGGGDGIPNEGENPSAKNKESKTTGSNALIYQLYAPSDSSLGVFGGSGVSSFDGIFAADAGVSDIAIVSSGSKTYTVPKNVQESISKFIQKKGETLDDNTLLSASKLCSGSPVSEEDLVYARDFFDGLAEIIDLYGGYSGGKWISKIDHTVAEEVPEHNFLDNKYSYFVYGDAHAEFVGLIAVDYLKDQVFGWTGKEFGLELGPIENFDSEIIEYVDEYTAYEVSKLLGGTRENDTFSLADIFVDERNLFSLAQSEMDFGFLDEVAKFAYSSGDRSLDAQVQPRGQGGKFGGTVQPEAENTLNEDTKYFAIVDDVDKTAVMDIIAVVNNNGKPQVFKRLMQQWVPDEDLLTDIQGPTPPPVSLLSTEKDIKDVLGQVDSYDAGEDDTVTASGFALADGSLEINNVDDLFIGVYSVTQNPTQEGIDHIVKRAKALNRMDVLPEDWRISSPRNTPGYGPYGEVLVSSAFPQEMSNLERLENYWLSTDKVDWSSSYAIEYASDQLEKYLGRERAVAFATILKNKSGE